MTDHPSPHGAHEPGNDAPKNDFAALLAHVQTHPWTYIGGVAFVVLILIVTGAYRVVQKSNFERAASELARALEEEDPAKRATALAAIAQGGSSLAPRALYLQGESALEAGDTPGARDAFTKLRESHPDFEFVPEAVEGLGLIKEDAGQFAAARAVYEEILSKWPESAAGKRQPFNIARCLEGENDPAAAVKRYQEQLETFPGSTIAQRAQLRLTELRAERPDLFPAEAAEAATTVPDPPAPAAAAASPSPEAPAADTPAAEAPATAPQVEPSAPASSPEGDTPVESPATPQ